MIGLGRGGAVKKGLIPNAESPCCGVWGRKFVGTLPLALARRLIGTQDLQDISGYSLLLHQTCSSVVAIFLIINVC
jgi:hypothetical protein